RRRARLAHGNGKRRPGSRVSPLVSAGAEPVSCAELSPGPHQDPPVTNATYSEHPSMFRSNPLGFILAVLLVAVAIGVLILLWWYLKCKSTKLEADSKTVMLERGLLSKERIELDTNAV